MEQLVGLVDFWGRWGQARRVGAKNVTTSSMSIGGGLDGLVFDPKWHWSILAIGCGWMYYLVKAILLLKRVA